MNTTPQSTDAGEFSRRLRDAAQRRGLTSDRSRSGVDVVALAAAAECSYEMARRYAEGLAMPKPEAVRLLARWLRVNPAWLMYGEGEIEGLGDIDPALLEACLTAVAEAQTSAGVQLSTDRLAHLVAALYREARSGVEPSAASVAATLRALGRR